VLSTYYRKIINGVGWNSAGLAAARIMSAATKLILAAILAPEIFGLVAMAMLAINILKVVADGGISTALIQKERAQVSSALLTSSFWASMALGTGATLLITFPTAHIMAIKLGEPDLYFILLALAPLLLMYSAAVVPEAILVKKLAFKQVATAEILATALSSAAAIILAYAEYGIYALIWQHVLFAGCRSACLFFLSQWSPSLRFRWKELHGIVSFSLYTLGTKLIHFLRLNADNLVISVFLGATSLGIYSLAYGFTETIRVQVSQILSKVMLPVYSELQKKPQDIGPYFLVTTEAMSVFLVPIALLLFFGANPAVQLLLEDEWQGAIQIIQILSLSGILFAVFGPSAEVLLALGDAKRVFKLSLLNLTLVTLPLTLVLTFWYGLPGTASAMVITLFGFRAATFGAVKKRIDISAFQLGQAVGPSILIAFILVASYSFLPSVSSPLAATATLLIYSLLAKKVVRKIRDRAPSDVHPEVR